MSERIDARGLSCPQPVILVKKAIEKMEKGNLEVLVDTVASKENISRMARNAGYEVMVEEKAGEFLLIIIKE
ncbi:MAG: sulfurtransferase TusA family protein [Deltaproteobacteria bacterium]|nr:sulfurtransferase TusA family protein [Deltaproteobacteria bacterium]